MTIKDIAKACGVSVSTVSRVLNDRPDVSPAVRKRVLDAVAQSNFIPNTSARDLVKSQSDAIGVVVRSASNLFFDEVVKTISREIDLHGYTMVLRRIDSCGDELKEGAMLEREKKLLGILFLGGRFDYSQTETAMVTIPFVCCSYTNCFGNLPEESFASVSVDDQQVACQAVERLIELGHRRIAAIVPSRADRSISELRYLGYRAALGKHGISYDQELVIETGGSFEMEETYEAVGELLRRGTDFTAIFTLSDTMAMAAMKALADHGRSVPESCSVIGIDGVPLSAYTIPTLTTLIQPAEEMGRASVALLLRMIEGRGGPERVLLGTTLRPGGSAARIET